MNIRILASAIVLSGVMVASASAYRCDDHKKAAKPSTGSTQTADVKKVSLTSTDHCSTAKPEECAEVKKTASNKKSTSSCCANKKSTSTMSAADPKPLVVPAAAPAQVTPVTPAPATTAAQAPSGQK